MKITISGKSELNILPQHFYDDEEDYEELTIIEHLLYAFNCLDYGDNKHNRTWGNVGNYCYRFILTKYWHEDDYQWELFDNIHWFAPNKIIRLDGEM